MKFRFFIMDLKYYLKILVVASLKALVLTFFVTAVSFFVTKNIRASEFKNFNTGDDFSLSSKIIMFKILESKGIKNFKSWELTTPFYETSIPSLDRDGTIYNECKEYKKHNDKNDKFFETNTKNGSFCLVMNTKKLEKIVERYFKNDLQVFKD